MEAASPLSYFPESFSGSEQTKFIHKEVDYFEKAIKSVKADGICRRP